MKASPSAVSVACITYNHQKYIAEAVHSVLNQTFANLELIVVDAHRRSHAAAGKAWSEPIAYHWLRYEDPNPVARLLEGSRKLRRRGVNFDSDAVDKALSAARQRGFSI